jgi:hypothetical protein
LTVDPAVAAISKKKDGGIIQWRGYLKKVEEDDAEEKAL